RLASSLAGRQATRAGFEARRTPRTAYRSPAASVGRGFASRAAGAGLHNPALDACAYRPAHPGALRRGLQFPLRRPTLARAGLELPEAPNPCQGAKRRRDCPLGRRGMASDKKGAIEQAATLAFHDESGFSLKPSVRRTWSPR